MPSRLPHTTQPPANARLPLGWLPILAGLGLLATMPGVGGCRSAGSDLDALVARASYDMNCDRDAVEVAPLGGTKYGVRGCDQRATYTEVCTSSRCVFKPVPPPLPQPVQSSGAAREVLPAPAPQSREILPAPPPGGQPREVLPAPPPEEIEVPEKPEAQTAPEAPPEEELADERPTPPSVSHVWVGGYWWWHTSRYLWVPGYWCAPMPGYVYVGHRWVLGGGGWMFTPGGWARPGGVTIVVGLGVRPHRRVWVRPRHPVHHRGRYSRSVHRTQPRSSVPKTRARGPAVRPSQANTRAATNRSRPSKTGSKATTGGSKRSSSARTSPSTARSPKTSGSRSRSSSSSAGAARKPSSSQARPSTRSSTPSSRGSSRPPARTTPSRSR